MPALQADATGHSPRPSAATAQIVSLHLGFFGDHFSLVNSKAKVLERYAIGPHWIVKPKALAFRRDQMFVTWDVRGLTTNNGRRVRSTKLEAIPVSPRLRKRNEIKVALDNHRDLRAMGVSGGRRLGAYVYLVARWQRSASSIPWLEALVRVNITDPNAEPEALAIVDGASFSAAQIEDNLSITNNKVFLPVHKGAEWGLWTYDPSTSESTYTRIGEGIKYARPFPDDSVGFIEKTPQGGFLAGSVDASTLERHDGVESDDYLSFVDPKTPGLIQMDSNDPVLFVQSSASGSVEVRASGKHNPERVQLHWLNEGRTVSIPKGAEYRVGAMAVVVWIGGQHPTEAWAYGVLTGRPVASWSSATKKPPITTAAGAKDSAAN